MRQFDFIIIASVLLRPNDTKQSIRLENERRNALNAMASYLLFARPPSIVPLTT